MNVAAATSDSCIHAQKPDGALPERRSVLVSGARVSYVEAGQGEPVLLLHGYPQGLLTWRYQFPHLAKRYRVIAPDFFGWAESERRFDLQPHYWDEVARIDQLLDALRLPSVNLVAHDYGAFLSLGFAGHRPKRVLRLAILNSRAHRTFPLPSYVLFWLLCVSGRTPGLRRIAARLPLAWLHRLLLGPYLRKACFDRSLMQRYIGWMDEPAGRRWLIHFFRHYELPQRPEVIEHLRDITCPSAIIWGDRDPYCPWRNAEDLAHHLPQATLTRIAGADHFVMEERPEEVLRALEEMLHRPLGP